MTSIERERRRKEARAGDGLQGEDLVEEGVCDWRMFARRSKEGVPAGPIQRDRRDTDQQGLLAAERTTGTDRERWLGRLGILSWSSGGPRRA